MAKLTIAQEKQIKEVVNERVEKEVEKKVEEEVKKISRRMSDKAMASARVFSKEFKKQTLAAITAAFAFLIALTWRTPIQKSIDQLVLKLGLNGQAVYYEYLAAVIITIIGVMALIIISKWATNINSSN